MHFPSQDILLFIKAVDELVQQIANNDGMKKHGKIIIEVASQHVKADPNVKNQFEQALLLPFDTLDPIREAVTSVYTEFLRKHKACRIYGWFPANSSITERISNTVRTNPLGYLT